MVHWAKQNGFDWAVVKCMMTETFNENYEHYDDQTIDNEVVATGSKDNAAITKVLVDNVGVCKVLVRTDIGENDDIVVEKSSKHQQDGEGEARMPKIMGGGGTKKAMNTRGSNKTKKNTPREGTSMAKGINQTSSTTEDETSRNIVNYLKKKGNKVSMLLTWKKQSK